MSEEERYYAAYAEILQKRGYLVFGSDHQQEIGHRHDGGVYPHNVSQPFYIIGEATYEDLLPQIDILEKHGFMVSRRPYEYHYRVNTD
jgi:hypothetical protein